MAAKTKRKRIRDRRTKTMELPEDHNKFVPGLMHRVDGRTNLSRYLKSGYREVCDDLGGEENLSYIQRSLIEQYVYQVALLRYWQNLIAENPTEYASLVGNMTQSVNAVGGLATKLGIGRKERPAKSMRQYIVDKS